MNIPDSIHEDVANAPLAHLTTLKPARRRRFRPREPVPSVSAPEAMRPSRKHPSTKVAVRLARKIRVSMP
jgi:hypothetical protein